MTDSKSLLTLVLAIIVIIGVGAAAIAYGPAILNKINQSSINTNQNQTNENQTNQNGNVTSFEGNITQIKSFDNGTYIVTVQAPVSAAKDKQYQDNIVQVLKKKAGQFANICTITITTKDNASSQLIYEKHNSIACKHIPPVVPPTPTPVPVPPVVNETPPVVVVPPIINNTVDNNTEPNPVPIPVCKDNEHLHDGVCMPNPTPVPTPTPQPVSNETIKVILTGDIGTNTDSTSVFNAIKKQNADNVVILGDLGYSSSLSWFKSTYGTLGNKLNCVIGNHDSASEDGSSAVDKEAKAYCANSYYFKKNHVLFLGFNTNGDLNLQGTEAAKLLTNTAFMNGIKSIHIMSHKPCAVAPNAHHPLEIKAFCDFIKSKIPTGVKQYYDQAHNHVMSASADGTYKTIGAGGKSHYTCGVSAAFPFCDNAHFGFLEYTIQPDGTTTSQFEDYNGKVIQK